ncbi:MAG TPA: hypothetical protein VGF48_23715 [Thermoanaerobaculia bacterium]
MPSGYEVEAATIVTPVSGGATPVTYGSGIDSGIGSSQSGLRGKLDSLKSRGTEKLSNLKSRGSDKLHDLQHQMHHIQHQLHDRTAMAKSSLRTNMDRQVTNVNTSMRENPMKWVGIAAGAGFGIGLIGRIMHWKNQHRHMTPTLVIIESSC